MRLTSDVLLHAETYTNAVKDRELNLRGHKIPLIENLAVIQDQVDVIDLSENEIRVLENFPKMPRLSSILGMANGLSKVGAGSVLSANLPNLTSLILTDNKIATFIDLYNLAFFQKLEVLSLLDNPISHQENYRNYLIHKIPSLKLLDFEKVKRSERDRVKVWAKSKEGKSFIAQTQADAITAASNQTAAQTTAASSFSLNVSKVSVAPRRIYTDEEKAKIRAAIERASSAAEVDLIEKQLKNGTFNFAGGDDNHVNGSDSPGGKRKLSEVE